MLIDFKITNFRSIREEQTLSLVASNYEKDLPDCVIEQDLPGLSGVKFLRGAAIYGANASGKSNVLQAIRFLANFVCNSATKIQPGESTQTEPFKLDQTSITQPSKFEITFVAEDIRYLFGLSLTTQRVIEEYLVAYPKGLPQRWYHRTYDEQQQTYTWTRPATGFKRDKSLEEKTRENSAFLSVAPQFNHPQLTPVFNWFQTNFHFIQLSVDGGFGPDFSASQLTKPSYHDRILTLLKNADIGVSEAKVVRKPITIEMIAKTLSEKAIKALKLEEALANREKIEIQLSHKVEGMDPVSLDFESEESAGTRRFFSLIGPWIDILENGKTVFIDEIETSLHPLLIRELLKLLFSAENNPKGAQVVFTTHNPILLDTTLMRRDQIWFTEKSSTGATHLYPLTDYQPRKDEALAKGYLSGRYGGIPFIPEGL
jgi:AAA15 family ATPase/GTPase